ncbi:hypothetical protein H4R35_006798, partial [Dimargaris xerosporica]
MKVSVSTVGVLLLGLLAHSTASPVPQLPGAAVHPRALVQNPPAADSARTHVRRLSARLNRVPMLIAPSTQPTTVTTPMVGPGQLATTTPSAGTNFGLPGTSTGVSNLPHQGTGQQWAQSPQSSQLGSGQATSVGTFGQFPPTTPQNGGALQGAGGWPGFSTGGTGLTGTATTTGVAGNGFWSGVATAAQGTTTPQFGVSTPPQQVAT